MIAAFEKNFIFIKTKKTAGTSIEIALSKFCGKTDIITPISVEDELLRIGAGALPRNYSSRRIIEVIHRLAILTRSKYLSRKTRIISEKYAIFWDHMRAEEIKDKIDTKLWYRAKKLSIERHPYEKVISQAYYRIAKIRAYRDLTFKQIIDDLIDEGAYRNFDIYSINGKIAVDYVMRYEDLMKELEVISSLCGLPQIESLPKAKAGLRTDRRNAFEILSTSQKKRIQDICIEEFELFGYEL